ncbi:type II toxin-antitoxin system RelE/ParE family toxin [Paenibacillus sp. FSL L8-0638]|uniref:type II toxin-antitoxin system RelE/ParE family toxin n=1 Tax=Paenibacillus TaxID=44249 RepID=UPI003159489D
MEKKYKLRYLTLAQSDLLEIVNYISEQLSAPQAAINLVDKLDRAISKLEQFPFSGHLYKKNFKLKDEFRMLVVENYIVFYVVFDDIIEIRRVIYSKRNHEKLL